MQEDGGAQDAPGGEIALREHLIRGYTVNRQRFEHNARELEAALELML
jgi:hypothetical protein